MNSAQNTKLSIKTKIGFGVGDIFGGGSMMIVGLLYLYFLTDVILISPALAGVVFLVSKAWDAISDPLMGVISDRTRTRFGRRRPYFLFGMIFVAISFFMMWYPVNFSLESHRFIYVIIAYFLFSTAYTVVMIPYFSLASELTTNYHERTSLTTYRMFFSQVSSLICAVIPMEITKWFPEVRTGYIIMAAIFAIFFSLPFLVTFLSTKERKEFQKESLPFDFKTTFIQPFKTPTFVNVLFMYLFSFVTMDIIMSIMIYFMTYYLKRGGETNFVFGTLLISQLIALPIFAKSSRKIGKRNSFLIAVSWWIIVMAFSFLIHPQSHFVFIYFFAGFVGLGTGGVVVMMYSIFPDVPDIDELYSGKRQEGIYSGLLTFMRKASSALGIFIVSQVIALAGYKKPVEQVIDGTVRLVKQEQSAEFVLVLKMIFAILPILFLCICAYNIFRYRLTPEIHNRLNIFLTARRTGGAFDADEGESLKKALSGKT